MLSAAERCPIAFWLQKPGACRYQTKAAELLASISLDCLSRLQRVHLDWVRFISLAKPSLALFISLLDLNLWPIHVLNHASDWPILSVPVCYHAQVNKNGKQCLFQIWQLNKRLALISAHLPWYLHTAFCVKRYLVRYLHLCKRLITHNACVFLCWMKWLCS